MKYRVLIREDAANRYTATVLAFPECKAEGYTESEALAKVTEAISDQLQQGKIVEIEVPSVVTTGDFWVETAGRSAEDPDFDEYLSEIEDFRKSMDSA